MKTENPHEPCYLINETRYEVSREFSEAVPLHDLLRQELTDEFKHRLITFDQAANL